MHSDKLRTSPTNKAFREGYDAIKWNTGPIKRVKRETRHRGVISDSEGFVSPIDGKWVEGRSAIREHEKKHGVRQCGDDYTSSEKPEWWDSRG